MTTLLPKAKSQFFDANGAPLAGGSVYFYIPSTTAFKTTWQDSGQVTANTNPVILDSAGEAVIFGSGSYRQIVNDALGNLIWDQLTSSTDATGIALGGALRGYLSGLSLSFNSTTKINVSAGTCTDDTNSFLIGLIAGTIDCTIVGKNGLDAGALANTTWYHVFAIAQPSGFTPAFLASTSLNPALPATYTLKRRIGSFKTDGSAHILSFVQIGDYFLWALPGQDVAVTNLTSVSTLFTLNVPTGVSVVSIANYLAFASVLGDVIIQSGLVAGTSPGVGGATLIWEVAAAGQAGLFELVTDTSGRIRATSTAASTTFQAFTQGWRDFLGRNN